MIKGKYYLIILGIVVAAAVLLRLASLFNTQPTSEIVVPDQEETFILEGQNNIEVKTKLEEKIEPEVSSEVIINQPQINDIISSPLIVSGQARGSWFFEASLPIKLLDDNGNVLALVAAESESDWMTSDLVPFKALIEFNSATSTNGYLVIAKDNPSGLDENSASISLPVRFLIK